MESFLQRSRTAAEKGATGFINVCDVVVGGGGGGGGGGDERKCCIEVVYSAL